MEHAALLLLRSLVTRLERGEVVIAELASGQDVLSLKWASAWPAPPPDTAEALPASVLIAGDPCPQGCGRQVLDVSGSLMCMGCGTVG